MEDAVMEEEVALIKEALDAALVGRQATMGVGLSATLFEEFRKRGWLTIRRIGEWGVDAPVYHASHPTFPNWELPDQEFRVGGYSGETKRRNGLSPWAGY
jgi:hypothetical protein